jgi:hypothetical protein
MAFQTLQTSREIRDFSRFSAETAARRASVENARGPVSMPRNSGRNRTSRKLALLAQLDAIGSNW